MELQVKLTSYVKSLKKSFDLGEKNPCLERDSVFKAILSSDLPENEKSIFRLGAEASGLIGAGTETTAWSKSKTLSRQIILTRRSSRCRNLLFEDKARNSKKNRGRAQDSGDGPQKPPGMVKTRASSISDKCLPA